MPLIKIFFLLFRHDGGVCFFVGIYIYNICIWIMGKYLTFQSPQVLYFVLSHVSLGPQDSSVHGSRSKGCLAFRASQATVAACYGERYGPFRGMQSFFHQYDRYPLKTNECPLKIGHPQKGTIVFQPSIFGCELLVWKIVFFLAFTIFFHVHPPKNMGQILTRFDDYLSRGYFSLFVPIQRCVGNQLNREIPKNGATCNFCA